MATVNLKEWAREQGVSYSAALRWFKWGKLLVPAYQADRLIVIGEPASISPFSFRHHHRRGGNVTL
jgi:predicted site-specific integrase-resolvase